MSYPVRLVGGTDVLNLPGDPRTYAIGDVIDDLSDQLRGSLQMSGVRFEMVEQPPAPPAPMPKMAPRKDVE